MPGMVANQAKPVADIYPSVALAAGQAAHGEEN
jgi:hypothetical protein